MNEWKVVKRTGDGLAEQTFSVKADGSFGAKWERPELLRLEREAASKKFVEEMSKSPFFRALKNVMDGR